MTRRVHRFLANENIPPPSIRRLREVGHGVAAIREDAAGADDADVLARAWCEQRILLTLDSDCGELIFHSGLPTPPGVVYVRLASGEPEAVAT